MQTTRNSLLVPLGLILVVAATAGTVPAADALPNILFIMSDDHAAHAIGAYGGRLAELDPTPTIDRLAREGALLTNVFCTNSICTPSRATIMTGQYSHVNGVKTLNGSVPAPQQHLARLLNGAGYETAMIGKWHLQAEPAACDFYTVLPGQGSYFNPLFCVRGSQPWPQNTYRVAGYDSTHSSDAITDISLKWLKQRQQKDKPFFLMHHFKAPHDNFENAERYDWLYQNVEIPEPESLRTRGRHGPLDREQFGTSVGKRNTRRNMGQHMFVDSRLADDAYQHEAYQRYLKKYLRCVRGVDDSVARLIAHLEATGELDKTVIVYTADQGFMLGEHDYIDKRWMAHHDNPSHLGIRTQDFKLIHFYGQPLGAAGAVDSPTDPYWELYDLRTDPQEMNNVIADPTYAHTLAALKQQLFRLQKQVGDSHDGIP